MFRPRTKASNGRSRYGPRSSTGRVFLRRVRHSRVLNSRFFRIVVALFVLFNIFEVIYIQHHHAPHHDPNNVVSRNTRLYIASTHWNNEEVLRKYWNNAVVDLVKTVGPRNVFVSVYESGSWDDSKGALTELDGRLGLLNVQRNITLSDVTHLDEIRKPPSQTGWIDTSRGRKELRRIPYLSRLRNYTLWNLEQLAKQGITFDKVLFLNDVVFKTEDIYTLLATNDGHYSAACSLDFSKLPVYYDTFALRDSEGHEHVMPSWPYLRSRQSRHAIKKNQPVPVTSCWNGLVVMPTAPFLHPYNLRFRGISDSLAKYHLEGSECCLIHADNPKGSDGVFLNPRVRVGYNGPAYHLTNPNDRSWLSSFQILRGLWENRIRRWLTSPMIKEWTVRSRVKEWKTNEKTHKTEPGVHCLINEMQVLVENGWAHV